MATVRFDAGPRIGDDVLIQMQTTDAQGEDYTPYRVRNVTIYYLERGVASNGTSRDFTDGDLTISFSNALPVKVLGGDDTPAWRDDLENPLIELVLDDEGHAVPGLFQFVWMPEFAREGEYFVCWTWEPIVAATPLSSYLGFTLKSDTTLTTTLPTQATREGKYEKLMDRYLPEMYKKVISNNDITPDIIQRFNSAIAEGFTELEDKANQILALQDANALNEALLPYLSNLFSWKLKTTDPNLHRRQIKRAIPLYKAKGTYRSLEEGLDECGIALKKVTKYWQVTSKSTFQEAFIVQNDGDTSFTLSNVPLLPIDELNFELSIFPSGGSEYVSLTSDDVSITVDDGVGYMDWVGEYDLSKGDIIKVLYKVAEVADQNIEDYIRSLPLMDNRSEVVMRDEDICYPKKNWNIRLIADDDEYLPLICPTRHPYAESVVFGKVRTEFPYSEKIYNMDEYNGCVVGSTLVTTDKGIRRIDTLTGDEQIMTEYGPQRFDALICHGKRQTLVVETKMGRKLTVTPNHHFRTINEEGELVWIRADEMTPDVKLLGKKGGFELEDNASNSDWWYLAGYAYGDGCLYKDQIYWLIPDGEEEAKDSILKTLISNKSKHQIREITKKEHQKHTPHKCNKSMWRISTSRTQAEVLGNILPPYEVKGGWKKSLPASIWTSSKQQRCSFLSGLFDSDGAVQKGKPVLTTKWHSLAVELQSLLLDLSIIGTITSYPVSYKGEVRTHYRVRVVGESSVEQFQKLIGFKLSRKQLALEGNYLSTNVAGEQTLIFRSDRTVIPMANVIVANIFPSKKRMSRLAVKNRSGHEQQTVGLISRLKQSQVCVLPDNRVTAVLEKANDLGDPCPALTFLNDYVENGWFFDTVKSVKTGGVENVYDPLNVENTQSYLTNGLVSHNSTRDSTVPCDIDRDFLDECPCCLSSNISIDVELQNMSNDRMSECLEVIRDFVPYHARLHSVNFNGSIEEFILPPVEEIECWMSATISDTLIDGQMVVNRTIQPWTENLKREMLATANNLVTDSDGVGRNIASVLNYSAETFDTYSMGLNESSNLLEILSGVNAGNYSVLNANKHVIDIDGDLPSPFNTSDFPFRLSNIMYTGGGDIYQDDKFVFSDATVNFTQYNIVLGKDSASPWKITVASGIYAGTYDIYDIQPDGSLVLEDWPGVVSATGLDYSLYNNGSTQITLSTAGKVSVERRGRFESSDDLVNQYGIKVNFYLLLGGSQYQITEMASDSSFYVTGYTAGTQVGVSSIKMLKRLVNNGIGTIGMRGMALATSTNYYNDLQVSDQLDDDQHMENFVILIGTDYYQISDWSNTANGSGRYEITLNGTPLLEWGLNGTSNVEYSIVQFLKTSPVEVTKTYPTIVTHTVNKVDRSGNTTLTYEQESSVPAALAASYLNAANNGQPFEVMSQKENISYWIQYKE